MQIVNLGILVILSSCMVLSWYKYLVHLYPIDVSLF